MDDKADASLHKESIDIFIEALNSAIKICNCIHECGSCPLYDAEMDNLYDASCFPALLTGYAEKLSQSAKDIEEKGE